MDSAGFYSRWAGSAKAVSCLGDERGRGKREKQRGPNSRSLTPPNCGGFGMTGAGGKRARFIVPLPGGGGGVGDVGVGFGEVAAAGADLVALVIGDFDADFVVLAVEDVVGGDVGDGVLVAEFVADVLEGLVEVVDVIGIEGAAAGFFGEVLENFVAFGEMGFAVGDFVGIGLGKLNPLGAGADGVNDHAGALSHFDGFGASVIGEIVVAIADENHDGGRRRAGRREDAEGG